MAQLDLVHESDLAKMTKLLVDDPVRLLSDEDKEAKLSAQPAVAKTIDSTKPTKLRLRGGRGHWEKTDGFCRCCVIL